MGELELRVLATVGPAGSRTMAIAERLGQPDAAVRAAVVRLVQARPAPGHRGRRRVDSEGTASRPRASIGPGHPTAAEVGSVPTVDLTEVAQLISNAWPTGAERAAAEEAARHGLLASDADRDAAVQQLSDAFSQGRLSSAELEQRTRHGARGPDLRRARRRAAGPGRSAAAGRAPSRAQDGVLRDGLPVLALRDDGRAVPRVRDDVGDHVFGLVLLVLLLPGLFGLWRWAWPRR